jgi:hypothetical protein
VSVSFFAEGGSVFGYNLMHKLVQRVTSNASAVSGISGFSDDDCDDDDDCLGVTSGDAATSEPRQSGLVSSSVYAAYIQSGGLVYFSLFLVSIL